MIKAAFEFGILLLSTGGSKKLDREAARPERVERPSNDSSKKEKKVECQSLHQSSEPPPKNGCINN